MCSVFFSSSLLITAEKIFTLIFLQHIIGFLSLAHMLCIFSVAFEYLLLPINIYHILRNHRALELQWLWIDFHNTIRCFIRIIVLTISSLTKTIKWYTKVGPLDFWDRLFSNKICFIIGFRNLGSSACIMYL